MDSAVFIFCFSLFYFRDIETETTKKENEVSGQNSSIDITKQSVPIFPHMGQVIRIMYMLISS